MSCKLEQDPEHPHLRLLDNEGEMEKLSKGMCVSLSNDDRPLRFVERHKENDVH
ncbi:hypothetical protein BDV23DRAFT_153888 [Aspergillus alliaceus]|uniref:Uncharacterized protein n=1 Tax=Petromyces alliaceus TaxID=209559 RepID=A0A5N7CA67_PETAA|nr:hypothetical protein BDV23DRAFT_153888 [Aspergillus alliaceus]